MQIEVDELGKPKCITCEIELDNTTIVTDFDRGEKICSGCGTIIAEQRNNDFFTFDAFYTVYSTGGGSGGMGDTTFLEDTNNHLLGRENKSLGMKGVGMSGSGNNIITSYNHAMDFSYNGIMSSKMDEKDLDYLGNRIKDYKLYSRLRYMNKKGTKTVNREKNLMTAILTVKNVSEKLCIPQRVQERGVNIYRDVFKINKLRSQSIRHIALSCLYHACREENLTISLPQYVENIMENNGISENKDKQEIQKKISKSYKHILNLLSLDPIPAATYREVVIYMSNKHALPERMKRETLKLGESLIKKDRMIFQGKSPTAVGISLMCILLKKHYMQLEENHGILVERHRDDSIINVKDFIQNTKISIVTIKKLCNEYLTIFGTDDNEYIRIIKLFI